MNKGMQGNVVIVADGLFPDVNYRELAERFDDDFKGHGFNSTIYGTADDAFAALKDGHNMDRSQKCYLVFLSNCFFTKAQELLKDHHKWLRIVIFTGGEKPAAQPQIIDKMWIHTAMTPAGFLR